MQPGMNTRSRRNFRECQKKKFIGLTCLLSCLIFTALSADAQTSSSSFDTIKLEPFTNTTVLVKYVAGTIPIDNPDQRRKLYLGKLGCLVSTGDTLLFRPYPNQSRIRRFGGFLTHLANPDWAKGRGQCPTQDVPAKTFPQIAYENMQVLARGEVQNLSSASTSDLQLLSGIGSLAGASSINSAAGYISLGTVAAVSLGYYLNRRTQNYITIFIKKPKKPIKKPPDQEEEPNLLSGTFSVTPDSDSAVKNAIKNEVSGKFDIKKPKPDSDFCECDFAVFQVIDPHDYWNLSLLLNAKTGKAFISETKGTDSDSSK